MKKDTDSDKESFNIGGIKKDQALTIVLTFPGKHHYIVKEQMHSHFLQICCQIQNLHQVCSEMFD